MAHLQRLVSPARTASRSVPELGQLLGQLIAVIISLNSSVPLSREFCVRTAFRYPLDFAIFFHKRV